MHETKASCTFGPASTKRAGKLVRAVMLLICAASITYALPPDPCAGHRPTASVIEMLLGMMAGLPFGPLG